MKIAVVGIGYVGLVSGACFAEIGADVTCVDNDSAKINKLQSGTVPIFEPGLEDLVKKNVNAGRLHFTTSLTDVINDVEVIFSAVGTPPDEDGSADLRYVLEVAKTVGRNMNHYLVLVTKSTVPVGTAKKVKATIQAELDKRGVSVEFDVASNPEFLKEGAAIKDFMSPDRVVIGVESERAKELMTTLYRPFLLNNFRVLFMDIPSAEMTKYAANSMLATRISFMNDMANLCELVGADVNQVRRGIGADTRIGNKFLYAGCGYGGSCFPKDVKALIHTAKDNGYTMQLLEAVEAVNEHQKTVLFEKILRCAQDDVSAKTIAIWGLAFKPNTDDLREATSIVLIKQLLAAGAKVRLFDPVVKTFPTFLGFDNAVADGSIYFAKDAYDATFEADLLCLVTEWQEFRLPNWQIIKKSLKEPVIIDGRNIYDPVELKKLGFEYRGIGMKTMS
ncbi:MAG: UDP-glucose/GDP-mannose dehydrogenase family protein [Paludibacteraceae bacterium]|nr:UDP-glucose/GDP-mannose dehydrogenase family protein [Paludibacteraceae bacterium]